MKGENTYHAVFVVSNGRGALGLGRLGLVRGTQEFLMRG